MDLDRRSPNFYAAKLPEEDTVWLISAMNATQARQELTQNAVTCKIGTVALSKIGNDTHGIGPSVIGSFPYSYFAEHFE